jgi:heme/copper-type cytochrome/quinol oxidase subunit 4
MMNIDPALPWRERMRARIRLILTYRIPKISLPADCRKFRLKVAPLFVFALAISQLALFCFVFATSGLRSNWLVVALGSFVIALLSLGAAWLLSYLMPDVVVSEGVYGHSTWGRRRFARWEDIALVEVYRLFQLSYLRLHSKSDEKVTWIGLFHEGADEFLHEIKKMAPHDCPIQPFVELPPASPSGTP